MDVGSTKPLSLSLPTMHQSAHRAHAEVRPWHQRHSWRTAQTVEIASPLDSSIEPSADEESDDVENAKETDKVQNLGFRATLLPPVSATPHRMLSLSL